MKLAKIALLCAALLILYSILIPCSLLAQEQDIKDPLLRWMNNIAQDQLQARQRVIDQIHTVAEAEQRKQVVREKLLEILGRPAGLQRSAECQESRVKSRRTAIPLRRCYFQSLPNFYVTGDLYRPNRPGRYPAILYQSGHTQEGKPEPQRAAANLALKGFVVFATDPIGQGEREQTYDPQLSGALGRVVRSRAYPGGSPKPSDWRECGALFHLGCKARHRLPGQPAGRGPRASGRGGLLRRWSADHLHWRPGPEA